MNRMYKHLPTLKLIRKLIETGGARRKDHRVAFHHTTCRLGDRTRDVPHRMDVRSDLHERASDLHGCVSGQQEGVDVRTMLLDGLREILVYKLLVRSAGDEPKMTMAR